MKKALVLFVICLFLIGCNSPEMQVVDSPVEEVKMYGSAQNSNDNLFVPIALSELETYGQLIDRIEEIACNDSTPQILIKNNSETRIVFPVIECLPPPFDPRSKHYVFISNGQANYHSSLDPINLDSLQYVIQTDYAFQRRGVTAAYLVVIEADSIENTQGVKEFLNHLTRAFDSVETDLHLNILLWRIYTPPPEPPDE